MSKGSTWKIWDFHLHTPYSVLNNQFGNPENDETWEKYICKIEEISKEKNIAGIGITDYFTIDGYKKVLEYKESGRLKDVFIFPNIEFRVDKFITKRVNFHVIFSPEISPDQIEEGFLHDLDFVHENDSFEPPKTRKLKVKYLTEFGRLLQSQHTDFNKSDPFYIGCMNAIVQVDKIKEFLDNQFKGKHLLVLADSDLSRIDWGGQDHATRKQLIQMSHAVFSANEKSRDFYLGKSHESISAFLDEFKSLKPCIWGCDSHGFDDRFLKPDQGRYCWIKGETTWEGLKQILFEPEGRVRIQENSPEPEKSIYAIDQVKVSETKINENLSINEVDISLNPNLVTIIGGRGSGKTALLDLIAMCFQEGYKLETLENSFFHRLYIGDKSQKHSSNNPITVNLGFKSGEKFEKRFGLEEIYFDKSNIIYLTQNHFEEYSAYPDKLNKHIINLVFERFKDEKRKYDEMETEIIELEQDIRGINLEIDNLNKEINGQMELEINKLKIKEGELEDYSQRIHAIESNKGQSDNVILSLTSQLKTFKNKQRTVENVLNNLDNLNQDQGSFMERYRGYVESINDELTSLRNSCEIKFLMENLSDLTSIEELISHNNIILTQIKEEIILAIQTITKQINDLEGENRIIAELQQKVNDISTEIMDLNSRIIELKAKETRISKLVEERRNNYMLMMQKIIDLRKYLQKIIEKFENDKDIILNNLKFNACIDLIDLHEFVNILLEKIDNRAHSEDYLFQEFNPIFDDMFTLLNSDDPEADFIIFASSIDKIAQDIKLKKSTTYSDFYNTVFKKYFNIGLEIQFNNKALNDLSMGERAIVLLKILLALDDKPLLIDQPEEHLDNRYIYKELTPAFRNAKTKRQIIIATHNANLVVNTDAEQVIAAEHINGTLSYEIGTLEDINIRENIKSILEGGDEAFKKREEKYGFKF